MSAPEANAPADSLIAGLHALLFACGEPLGTTALASALELDDSRQVAIGLRVLQERLEREDSGVRLKRVAGGWQLRTEETWAPAILRARGVKPMRLSQAALEVLAIVAWRQPVTRSEVDAVRGVRSGPMLRQLMERGLVRSRGRRDQPGRPILYGTTARFLETYELPDLGSLPDLAERRDLQ